MFLIPRITHPCILLLGTAMGTLIPVVSAAGLSLLPTGDNNHVDTASFDAGHLQGITTNGTDAIYWSFTTLMVKTDTAGNTLAAVPVIDHHGDATFFGGKVYVAVNDRESVNPGQFNVANPNNPPRQWIYEYDDDLNFVTQHAVPELIYGAGGIAYHDGKFMVVGGQPSSVTKNSVYEYDVDFQYVETHTLNTGNTDRGIQTAEFAQGQWWFGTYLRENNVRQLLTFDESLPAGEYDQFSFNASYGIAALSDGHFLIGSTHGGGSAGVFGRVRLAVADDLLGFRIVAIPDPPLAIPEPSSFALLGIGALVLVLLSWFRYRRRLVAVKQPSYSNA